MPAPPFVLAGRVARRARRSLEHMLLGRRGPTYVPLARAHAGGVIDGIEVGADGTLSVIGWAPDRNSFAEPLHLQAHGLDVSPSHVFGVTRPDLAHIQGDAPTRFGIVVEFILPIEWSRRTVELLREGDPLALVPAPELIAPAYSEFYGNPGVWHRAQVYGVGPPVRHVSSELLDLCNSLPEPVLDFGCGAGALVGGLRSLGVEASGLELNTLQMREALLDEARPHVTLYDGAFPAPFREAAFASVTCCEVLEHIPDYGRAVGELARLARDELLITVPDMSAIPRGHAHGVVPWHLMEASHVNFFTQQSLEALLRPHFPEVQFFRIGEVRCERLRFYTSLAALCRR